MYLVFGSIILKEGMIWLSSSKWCNKQGFMSILELVHMLVLNGTLGKNGQKYIYFCQETSPVLIKYVGIYYLFCKLNFRGFPVWLKYVPGISFRTDNGPFKV